MDKHSNLIIVQAHAPAQPAARQPLIDINQLRKAFSNPKADILLFYGDSIMDYVSAKFLLDRIKMAPTTYGWTDETTAGNFKLALRGKAIDWLNHTRDMLYINISTSTKIEPNLFHTSMSKPAQSTMYGTSAN